MLDRKRHPAAVIIPSQINAVLDMWGRGQRTIEAIQYFEIFSRADADIAFNILSAKICYWEFNFYNSILFWLKIDPPLFLWSKFIFDFYWTWMEKSKSDAHVYLSFNGAVYILKGITRAKLIQLKTFF